MERSVHDLLCKPSVAMPSRRNKANERGWTLPVGWLPALMARHFEPASALNVASARIDRQELPVHKNKTERFIAGLLVLEKGANPPQDILYPHGPCLPRNFAPVAKENQGGNSRDPIPARDLMFFFRIDLPQSNTRL